MPLQNVLTVRVSSIKEFINDWLFGELNAKLDGYIFRGVGDSEYRLIPNVLREDNIEQLCYTFSHTASPTGLDLESDQVIMELSLFNQFYTISDNMGLNVPSINFFREYLSIKDANTKLSLDPIFDKWIPPEFYELAALAQHYGLPTRVLDWSKNILTTLFFAASNGIKNYSDNGEVVIWALNVKFIDSMTYHYKERFPLKVLYPPYSNNTNLQAQAGLLTLWEVPMPTRETSNQKTNRDSLDVLIDKWLLSFSEGERPETTDDMVIFYKFIIPHNLLGDVFKLLHMLDFNESKIFPGYRGVVKRILNQQFLNKSNLFKR